MGRPTRRTSLANMMREAGGQAWAGARGAWDGATMGLGDRAYAAGAALVDKARGDTRSLAQLNQQRFAQEKARDAYDAQRYATARKVGQVGGVVASMAIPGGGVVKGVTALARQAGARAIPALARGTAGMTAVAARGGAASSVAGQAAVDVATGRRSDPREYAAAAVGGALGGATTRVLGAGIGGAVEGAVTSVMEDAFWGRAPDLDAAVRAAQAGNLAGKVGGVAGREISDDLRFTDKGKLGDFLAEGKAALQGEKIKGRQVRTKVENGDTILDLTTRRTGREIEAKFGHSAVLSDRQLEALGRAMYQIDHFFPESVGKIVGTGASSVASKIPDEFTFEGQQDFPSLPYRGTNWFKF